MSNVSLKSVYHPLWLTYGLVPIIAGADKFFGLLVDWKGYLSPQIAGILPVSPDVAMYSVGVIEMLVGIAILTRLPRLGAYVASAWLTLIALNLVFVGRYDIAVRDLVMAVGALSLGQFAAACGEPLIPRTSGMAHRPNPVTR